MISKRQNEARRWFQQAYYDLEATRWNIQGGFFDTACFLAQQASEKALKALLYYQGSREGCPPDPFPRGDGPGNREKNSRNG